MRYPHGGGLTAQGCARREKGGGDRGDQPEILACTSRHRFWSRNSRHKGRGHLRAVDPRGGTSRPGLPRWLWERCAGMLADPVGASPQVREVVGRNPRPRDVSTPRRSAVLTWEDQLVGLRGRSGPRLFGPSPASTLRHMELTLSESLACAQRLINFRGIARYRRPGSGWVALRQVFD
jgi:hypothetical protein